MAPSDAKRWLRPFLSTSEEKIVCPVCFLIVDIYADTQISWGHAALLFPYISNHLGCCQHCFDLYRELRRFPVQN